METAKKYETSLLWFSSHTFPTTNLEAATRIPILIYDRPISAFLQGLLILFFLSFPVLRLQILWGSLCLGKVKLLLTKGRLCTQVLHEAKRLKKVTFKELLC